MVLSCFFFFFQAEDGIRDVAVTGVQTCALPILRGETVFLEYWRRPDATGAAFRDGWFRTGDVAVSEHGAYRMLGRSSVDIIKTGGYKGSAVEGGEGARTPSAVAECAAGGRGGSRGGERGCGPGG